MTKQGRCLFLRESVYGEGDATWDHPDPSVDRRVYELDDETRPVAMFDALSYVWGTASLLRRRVALVEHSTAGKVAWTQVGIGLNLDLALRDLRDQNKPRVMWIDAVCINQTDVKERNQQVKRMADIYSQASQVVVWLGPTNGTTKCAVDVFKHIANHVELLQDGSVSPAPGTSAGFHRSDLQMPLSDEQWRSIHDLVSRSWFYRLWVVQEVLLGGPRTIMQSGHHVMSWDVFCRAVVALSSNNYISPSLQVELERAITLCTANHFQEAAKYILLIGAARSCSDRRDLVYGFLGLLSRGLRNSIQPDYSATLKEAYINFTLAYINQTRRLEVLDIAAHGHKLDSCPSWVFDPNSLQSSQGSYLVVQWPGQRWEPEDLYNKTYVTGESLLEAYARTLICGSLRDRVPGSWVPTLERWQGQYHTNALFGDLAKDGQFVFSDLTRQERQPLEMLVGRRFFMCDNGFIGIGPGDIQYGDSICVLLGHENPVVLREQPDGNYSLVGICYLHGVSDGSALLGPLPKPWVVHRMLDAGQQYMVCKFFNSESGVLCDEDPRLEPLEDQWERVGTRNRTAGDPEIFQEFRHVPTGYIVKSDPRLSLKALKNRGVRLETFSLV
ncbi:heterokaryon incompatibility protein-domain-containing protein [Xylaria telfairii]|nr:heterokaryon incompatibility protein-domain-containing protein [Xylaria telfairii]